jgi:heptaprenyl diphosphate synthase
VDSNTLFYEVRDELVNVERELASITSSQVDVLNEINEHLHRAGGKRLRPALYLLCAGNRPGAPHKVLPIAVAIELIHMATLVHDDVIDNAATRRGVPSANARWGNNAAVLGGDYLFAKAFSLLATLSGHEVLKILTDAICAMCEGEITQIRDSFNPWVVEEGYLQRIAQKTAQLIGASCQLGAMTAGLAAEEAVSLYQFGFGIGMAFQITDDILDVTASAEQLGKPTGNDLRQGVLTLPVIRALAVGNRSEQLREIILNRDMSPAKVKEALAIVDDTDGVDYSYSRVGYYLEFARKAIPDSINGTTRKSLLAIADFVGLRKF